MIVVYIQIPLLLPDFILFSQEYADHSERRGLVREDADALFPPAHFLIRAFLHVGGA